jgi:hypothetical protein
MLRMLQHLVRIFLLVPLCVGCITRDYNNAHTPETYAYECIGEVCADDGFDVFRDGFSFPNWNDTDQPHSMVNPQLLVSLFGHSVVCQPGPEDACTPTPRAQHVMKKWNAALIGGRCEGMATLSERMFMTLAHPHDFDGSVSAPAHLTRGNNILESEITFWWATQFIDDIAKIARESRQKKPSRIVSELIRGLQTSAGYTLGIYDKGMGHAVTPFAVSRTVDGWRIHIYDNNYPGVENHVDVNASTERWSYSPSTSRDRNTGDGFVAITQWSGTTGSIELTPMSARSGPFHCAICHDLSTSSQHENEYVISLVPLSRHAETGLEIITQAGTVNTLQRGPFSDDDLGIEVTVSKDATTPAMTQVRIPHSITHFDVRVVSSVLTTHAPPVLLTASHPRVASVQIAGLLVDSKNLGNKKHDGGHTAGTTVLLSATPSGLNISSETAVDVSIAATVDTIDIALEAGHSLSILRDNHTHVSISQSDQQLFRKKLLAKPLSSSSLLRRHFVTMQNQKYDITHVIVPEEPLAPNTKDQRLRPLSDLQIQTSTTSTTLALQQATNDSVSEDERTTNSIVTAPQYTETSTTNSTVQSPTPGGIGLVSQFSLAPHLLYAGSDSAVWIRIEGQRALFRVSSDGAVERKEIDGIPISMTQDDTGASWVALQQPDRLAKITNASVTYYSHSMLKEPSSILFHPNERLVYVTGGYNTGSYLGSLSQTQQFQFWSLTDFGKPDALTLGNNSTVWFIDAMGGSVGRKVSNGDIGVFRRSNVMARSLTLGPDNALWFANNVVGREIGRVSMNGTYSFFSAPNGVQSIRSMTTSPDGSMWMTARGNIVKMSLDKSFTVIPDDHPWGQSSILFNPDRSLWFTNSSFFKLSRITM